MSMIQPLPQHRRIIANWLLVCLALVGLMVFIGGITRLTESGLSIVEWKLLSGTLPPLTEKAWDAEFDAYKATPQFRWVNRDFTLGDFKNIYWLEYIHRLLGRVIGLAVILPFCYFAARKMLPRPLLIRGLAISVLVAAQGAVGWVMVASGLIDQPRVAPIKLAAHLLLAFTVFGLMLWTRWQVLGHPRMLRLPPLARLVRVALALVTLQIFLGALVAGLRAGLTYNTYPLMDGQFIPDGLFLLSPWWVNHLESPLMVQFQHRMGAIVAVLAVFGFAAWAWKTLPLRSLANQLALTISLQFCLGIATLITNVNMWLASAHQLIALVLVSLLLRTLYVLPLDANQHR